MRHTVFFLLAALGLPAAAAAADSRTCRVGQIEGGTVRIEVAGQWQDLTTTEVPAGTVRIATGDDTRIRIVCDDGIVVTVGTGTEIGLSDLAGPSGPSLDILLDLTAGIVGILAPTRTWDDFEVKTPLAIASVRSTEWLTEHLQGETAVFVRGGEVRVTTRLGSVGLERGEGITVAAPRTPEPAQPPVVGDVRQWSPERIRRSTAALGFDWQ